MVEGQRFAGVALRNRVASADKFGAMRPIPGFGVLVSAEVV